MNAKPLSADKEQLLSTAPPSDAIISLAVPASLALIAKAVYNIVDSAYIGLLNSETALAAVGVTLPLLLIFVSVENIFAAGAAVLAGRQLGSGNKEAASVTVSTIAAASAVIGALLCAGGILFMEPLLRSFGTSAAVMPQAKAYAFWMFIAALANLPAQSLNCSARAESSARIASAAVITGALLNVVLDPIFMFKWGLGLGVGGASLATTVSQFVTFAMLAWFYFSGRSLIKLHWTSVKPAFRLFRSVTLIGIPTAVIQLCLAAATSTTNIAAARLADGDLIIAAYGVVQRLVLIACFLVMGFMQGYQPVAAYSFGAGNKRRFIDSVRFAAKGALVVSLASAAVCITFSRQLIMLFNRNPAVVTYGARLLISQTALFPAFGLCYMMTITFQTIGDANYGIFLSMLRQGLLYVPCILLLPRLWGVNGIYAAQPAADLLTFAVCALSFAAMKKTALARI